MTNSLTRLNLSRTNYTRTILIAALILAGGALCASRFDLLTGRAAFSPKIAGTITGTVFQDYNANGTRDTGGTLPNAGGEGSLALPTDRGVSGVTVTAYDSAGAAVGTATSDANGAYSLSATGTGPYRVEFTNLPAGFQPGVNAAGKTAVQFVADGSTSGADLAINIPAEYCQNNPTIVTNCYVGGSNNGPEEVLVTFPMSGGTSRTTGGAPFADFDTPAHGIVGRANQIGTTWGLAYARSTRQLYAGAFMKKHAAYGPGGTGAIYRTDPTGSGTPSVYVDLNAIFGSNAAGANAHNTSDYDRDNGNAAWDAVGKTGLGGLAISGDETKLYTVNLATRQLIEIPLNAAPTAANIKVKAVPTNPPGSASANDVRPFAVTWYLGRLYVGLVNTAESTGNASQLMAYVYSVDPATLDFSAAPVFQMPLNYPRRCADSAQLGPGACFSAAWRPWSATYQNIGTGGRGVYPQPWLTGLTFDRGNLVLGFRDRSGDQFGNNTLDNPADSALYYGVSAGDILRASGNPTSGWTLESNGRAGGQGTAPQGTNEGPGGGEFYFGDVAIPFGDESTQGGVLQVGGFSDVLTTVYDPVPFNNNAALFDGGVTWFNNGSGARDKGYRVYNGALTANGPFGKANGLGDLEALCDPAPIELGNRIWRDTDRDGIQDANEAGIVGVTVQLYKNGALVGTTTTGNDGAYYFNASNVTGGILPQMAYEIRVAKTQAVLGSSELAPRDADGSANGDSRDSDAVMNGDVAVIALTTGEAGANNHTYDIGFAPPAIVLADLCVTKDDNRATYLPGDQLTYTIRVINYGPADVVNARVVDTLPATLQSALWECSITAPGTGTVTSACGLASGLNDINTTVTLRNGGVATFTLRARVISSANGLVVNTVTVTPPAGITESAPANNRATDTDSNQNATSSNIGPGIVPPNPGNSILIYPVYTSSAASPSAENTRINITNASPSQPACVHMFFVDGASCSVADSYICLTPNQTASFLASDLDPGTMGYMVAVAVDCATGCPTNFNYLLGDEYAKFSSGFAGNLKAECVPYVGTGPVVCNTDQAVINMDGTTYARVPQTVAMSNIASLRDGNNTLLVLDRIGGNLGTGVGTLGTIFGILYDDSESAYSFSLSGGGSCQLKGQLSDNFPRILGRFSGVIPEGRTGWAKLSAPTGIGIVGAQFTANANAASSASAFTGAHGLHALTAAPTASFTVPVFPPTC